LDRAIWASIACTRPRVAHDDAAWPATTIASGGSPAAMAVTNLSSGTKSPAAENQSRSQPGWLATNASRSLGSRMLYGSAVGFHVMRKETVAGFNPPAVAPLPAFGAAACPPHAASSVLPATAEAALPTRRLVHHGVALVLMRPPPFTYCSCQPSLPAPP
jgi:hypothetical protein